MSEQNRDEGRETPGYRPVPKKRRGNRRATGGSAFGGEEPQLAGLTQPSDTGVPPSPEDDRATWLKEQRPPHY